MNDLQPLQVLISFKKMKQRENTVCKIANQSDRGVHICIAA